MKQINVEQGSQEWHNIRLGKVTGTTLKDVVGSNNLKLIDTLLAELLANQGKEVTTSKDMERGIDEEPIAIQEYEKVTGEKTSIVGFCISDEFDFLGCSPDRLIKKDGRFVKGVEVKCPNSSKHIEYLRIGRIPNEYKYQIINYFIVCEDIQEVDFVSFDRRVLAKPIHIFTITRKELEKDIEDTKESLRKFKTKFDKYYEKLFFS